MGGTLRHVFGAALVALSLTASALSALALAPKTAADGGALDGFWMDSDGEVILKVEPCGDAHCGKVAWLRLPFGPDGQLLLDYRNPDPSLRHRPVCGLEVLSGFKRQEDGTWGDGSVYVSDLGMSFSGYAEVVNPKEVKVTGYVGLKLFGQSEVWKRVEKPFEICWVKPPKPGSPSPTPAATAGGTTGGTDPVSDAKAKETAPAVAPKPADTKVSPGALLPEALAKP